MTQFNKNMKATEFKVGIFVLVSLLMSIVCYGWLNDWFMKSRNETIKVLFETVDNLERGNTVYFRGVRVGRVGTFGITSEGVVVELLISNNLNIDKNALFVIKDRDMMGTKMVEITPGNSVHKISSNEIYYGTSMPGLVDLISEVSVLFANLEDYLGKIDEFIDRIDKIVATTDEGMLELYRLVSNFNNDDISLMIKEFKIVGSGLVQLIDQNTDSLTNTFENIDTLLLNSISFIDALHDILSKEDSNLNKFINDVEFYESLLNSSKELENLINDIKANPRHYFRFSIF